MKYRLGGPSMGHEFWYRLIVVLLTVCLALSIQKFTRELIYRNIMDKDTLDLGIINKYDDCVEIICVDEEGNIYDIDKEVEGPLADEKSPSGYCTLKIIKRK